MYREAHERSQLTLRCSLALSPTWETVAEAERAIPELAAWAGGRGAGDDHLRIGGICLHYGGDPEVARILHAGQPYTGWAGFVESANDPEGYAQQAELAARAGLRVNTLVTLCLPEVLEIWEAMAARTPIRDLRWVLVHHVATEREIARLRRLGAVATTNPISYLWRSGAAELARLGAAAEMLTPHRSLVRLGVPLGIATDNQANPWLAFMGRGRAPGHDDRPGARRRRAALTRSGSPGADSGRRLADLRRARPWGAGPGPRGGSRRARPRSTRGALPGTGRDHRAPDHGGAGRSCTARPSDVLSG